MDDPFRRGHGRGGAVEETSNPALDASHAAFAAMRAHAERADSAAEGSVKAPERPAPERSPDDAKDAHEAFRIAVENLDTCERDPRKLTDENFVYVMKMRAYRERNSHGRNRWGY